VVICLNRFYDFGFRKPNRCLYLIDDCVVNWNVVFPNNDTDVWLEIRIIFLEELMLFDLVYLDSLFWVKHQDFF
jgi:hypothetical protein